VRFYSKLNFLYKFSKKIFKYKISWKSVQWEPSCNVKMEGRTEKKRDVTKLLDFFFCNFAKAPTNVERRHFSQKVPRVNRRTKV